MIFSTDTRYLKVERVTLSNSLIDISEQTNKNESTDYLSVLSIDDNYNRNHVYIAKAGRLIKAYENGNEAYYIRKAHIDGYIENSISKYSKVKAKEWKVNPNIRRGEPVILKD